MHKRIMENGPPLRRGQLEVLWYEEAYFERHGIALEEIYQVHKVLAACSIAICDQLVIGERQSKDI